jgi:hypothetical protein
MQWPGEFVTQFKGIITAITENCVGAFDGFMKAIDATRAHVMSFTGSIWTKFSARAKALADSYVGLEGNITGTLS